MHRYKKVAFVFVGKFGAFFQSDKGVVLPPWPASSITTNLSSPDVCAMAIGDNISNAISNNVVPILVAICDIVLVLDMDGFLQ